MASSFYCGHAPACPGNTFSARHADEVVTGVPDSLEGGAVYAQKPFYRMGECGVDRHYCDRRRMSTTGSESPHCAGQCERPGEFLFQPRPGHGRNRRLCETEGICAELAGRALARDLLHHA